MTATWSPILALLAGSLAAGVALFLTRPQGLRGPQRWRWPAGLSVGFGAFSAMAVWQEGPLGFWHEHAHRGLWGNQIWFDLLLCALAALALGMPQARAVGMRVLPWTLLVLATGAIGLGLFLARLWYLQDRSAPT